MVKTLCLQCRVYKFDPWAGNEDPSCHVTKVGEGKTGTVFPVFTVICCNLTYEDRLILLIYFMFVYLHCFRSFVSLTYYVPKICINYALDYQCMLLESFIQESIRKHRIELKHLQK